jgi:SPP1 gp7 family putative phage head morphogenesis protein
MATSNYWIERSLLKKTQLEKNDTVFLGTVAKRYDDAMRSYGRELSSFWGRYSKEGVIPYTEAIKKMTAREQIEFIKYIDTLPDYDSDFKLYLKNLRSMSQISRIQQLKLENRITATQLSLFQENAIPDHLEGSMKKAYNLTLKSLDEADIGVLSRKRINQALTSNWSGVKLSDTLWKDKQRLISSLDTVLTDQFLRNASLRDATKALREKMDVGFSTAERIVRTESAHIVEQATLEAYTDAGIEKYEYIAVNDERTSDICEDLDGKTFLLSEAQVGVNYPPMHPNCRSTTAPFFS